MPAPRARTCISRSMPWLRRTAGGRAGRSIPIRCSPGRRGSVRGAKGKAMYEGGCECGRVRYRLTRAPIFVNCFHCRQGQKLGGSAFALNAMIESDRIEVLEGIADSAAGGTRCPDCKTILWAHHPMFGAAISFVRVGTLDEGERLAPDAHFFVRSRHGWVVLPEGGPAFETLPTETDPPLLDSQRSAPPEAARRWGGRASEPLPTGPDPPVLDPERGARGEAPRL